MQMTMGGIILLVMSVGLVSAYVAMKATKVPVRRISYALLAGSVLATAFMVFITFVDSGSFRS